jgi:hypothetical protein
MLSHEQCKEIYEAAEVMIEAYTNSDCIEVVLDGSAEHEAIFDPVEDGVWVRAWVKVPSALLTNYSMEPPAPPSSVTVESTLPKFP